MNIIKLDNLYPSPKEIISNREILLSINSFKLVKKGNNNNNNTAVNRERIDASFNKIYILPEDLK